MDDYVQDYPTYLRDRIVSIPNPVNSAMALAKPEGESGKVRRLLSVGRLSYQKNQSVLVEAFTQIAGRVPEWQLVLVGAGEDEAKLKQLVAANGLADRVVFTGAVKDVERQYLDSHLFCLPSSWEGFPNALAEAMAHGLPAVGYAGCAGVGQLIADGKTGLLAQGNGSPDALARTLLALMVDDDLRRRMGAEAVASMAHYTPSVIFDRWESLFKKLADRA
jgi:glycosyltransferase involved in cell wall biosynthesis